MPNLETGLPARDPARPASRGSGSRLIPLKWLACAAGLHLVWEIAQLPLFTLWHEAPPTVIAWAVIHCTGGDILIAAATYAIGSLVAHDLAWPANSPRIRPLAALIVSGVGYTFYSEWRNVYVLGAWAYTPSMPTVFDIGLSPLAQWIFVPLATTILAAVLHRQPWRS